VESIFQLIFHYITKHRKIIQFPSIHFPEINFPKENYFPADKQTLTTIHFPFFFNKIYFFLANLSQKLCCTLLSILFFLIYLLLLYLLFILFKLLI
jgi:hypothetical protein